MRWVGGKIQGGERSPLRGWTAGESIPRHGDLTPTAIANRIDGFEQADVMGMELVTRKLFNYSWNKFQGFLNAIPRIYPVGVRSTVPALNCLHT